jgi:drug/metabolite transporter (DMT)-like permease
MVFWGSAFVTSKMIVFDVPPEVGAVLRFGLGSVLMMGILFRRSAQPVPPRAAWGKTAAVGLVGVAAFNTAFFQGLALAPASDAAMIIPTLSPVFTAAAGMLFLGEPVRRRRVGGLMLSIAGAAVFFWGVLTHTSGQATRIYGDLFLLGAAGCWAAFSILSRTLLLRIGSLPPPPGRCSWEAPCCCSSPRRSLRRFPGERSPRRSGSCWPTWPPPDGDRLPSLDGGDPRDRIGAGDLVHVPSRRCRR